MSAFIVIAGIIIVVMVINSVEKYFGRITRKIDDLESRVEELESPNTSDSDEYPN
ncbi:MAG: hypothetical protein AAB352_03210 [Patescibacteria group bacterium]